MMKIIFEGKVYDVADMTNDCYICYPLRANEGYNYISKDKCEVI